MLNLFIISFPLSFMFAFLHFLRFTYDTSHHSLYFSLEVLFNGDASWCDKGNPKAYGSAGPLVHHRQFDEEIVSRLFPHSFSSLPVLSVTPVIEGNFCGLKTLFTAFLWNQCVILGLKVRIQTLGTPFGPLSPSSTIRWRVICRYCRRESGEWRMGGWVQKRI